MNTYPVRDVQRHLENYHQSDDDFLVITKDGQPVFLVIPFNEFLQKNGVALSLAVRLYQEEVISMGRAARVAGVSQEEFMDCLSSMGIPVIDYDPSELRDELMVFGS